MTITTRAGKGSPLTNTEIDANFNELDTLKAPKASPTFSGTATFTGPLQVTGEGNLSVGEGVLAGFVSGGEVVSAGELMTEGGVVRFSVDSTKYIGWNGTLTQFEFSNAIYVNGQVRMSGALRVSSAVQNSNFATSICTPVGGSIRVDNIFGNLGYYSVSGVGAWRYPTGDSSVASWALAPSAGYVGLYVAPANASGGVDAMASASTAWVVDTSGNMSIKTASPLGSFFGSSATYALRLNGSMFLDSLVTLGGAAVFGREVTGGGAGIGTNSAQQVGLHSTSASDNIAVGGGPAILFFGFDYDGVNVPQKQFISRFSGYVESNSRSNFYGGLGVFVRANHADVSAATLAARWGANTNYYGVGYQQLGTGAPLIKQKKLTGTTAASEGGTVSVAHGLTGSKIISFTCKVEYGASAGMPPGHTFWGGYQYDCYHDGTNFVVANHATNSENVLSKNFIILITYEE